MQVFFAHHEKIMIQPATLQHIAQSLTVQHIHLDATLAAIGAWLFDTTPIYDRATQARLCGVSRNVVFHLLHLYADAFPPRMIRAKLYRLDPFGEKTLTEWIIWRGDPHLSWQCVAGRLKLGWPLERALMTPVRVKRVILAGMA